MDPAGTAIIEVAKRLVTLCMQAAQAYNVEQSNLQLDRVLSQDRLCSTAGTNESLGVLKRLSALTAAHKVAFREIVLASSAAVSEAISKSPAGLQDAERSSLVATINWHLSAQNDFYQNRERWIKAAEDICHLIEARRATSKFVDAGVVFADDQDFVRLEALLQIIEETHQREVTQLNERMNRIAKSAHVLGLRLLT